CRKDTPMRAIKLTGPGSIEIQDVPVPDIAPDEVLIKVAAAGLCHSDLHILEMDETWPFFGNTIGHEAAGHVAALGSDVTGLNEGDAVLVSVVWFCGHCRNCIEGRTNVCQVNGSRTLFPQTPGIGPDGGMAEYMKVKAIHVDRIGDLDPISAAPLADAATTPMRAINSARHLLTPNSTVVLIAVGGLGHLGLQILKATTGARIIALDTDDSKLEIARKHGADIVLRSDGAAAEAILEATNGAGADVVFDFVGVQPTVTLARSVVAAGGAIRLVGLGGGSFEFAADTSAEVLPWGVDVQRSYGGTHQDQLEVIALAQQGKLSVETVRYDLNDFHTAFDDLHHGRVPGRAVLVP
ncbi:MAG: NAD(P)-dependent alcohol dehydrogenase, partial [Mycetocola sp.]